MKGDYMLRRCMFQKTLRALGLVLTLSLLSGVTGVQASEPEETIQLFTDSILEAMDVAEEDGIVPRYQIMHDAVGLAFDMKVLARATINRVHWKSWSKQQQQIYVETLRSYQSAVLADRFSPGGEISFVIDNTLDAPRGTKIVETRVVRGDGDEDDDIGLDYRLVKRSDRWRIIDIYLDSKISEVAMRRSEYSAVVRDEGYHALIAALEDQITEVLGDDYTSLLPEEENEEVYEEEGT
jgi:phospholipid transport system substrate-binding protein